MKLYFSANGIPAVDEHGQPVKLYFGIIDMLTKFNTLRQLEYTYKTWTRGVRSAALLSLFQLHKEEMIVRS